MPSRVAVSTSIFGNTLGVKCWIKSNAATLSTARTLKHVLTDIETHGGTGQRDENGTPLRPNVWDDLRDALGAFDPRYDGKALHKATAASYAIRRYKGRLFAGKRLVATGKDRVNATEWTLEIS